MRGPAWWLSAVVMVMMLSGCGGYHLGPSNGVAAGSRSVQINPFENKTLEPHLADYVTISLRKNLQRDGTYLVDTKQDGDIIMSGVITTYDRHELSVQPADVLTVLDYEITMTAQITAKERSSGRVVFDKTVKGRTSLRAGPDLTSAERQALPLLTDDLAKKATSLLVDGSW